MTTRGVPRSAPMKDSLDTKTRQRIAANLRLLRYEHRYKTVADMARAVGIHKTAMGRYLKGERTVGLDVALLIHRKLSCSLDWLVDRDPAAEWWDPEYEGPARK